MNDQKYLQSSVIIIYVLCVWIEYEWKKKIVLEKNRKLWMKLVVKVLLGWVAIVCFDQKYTQRFVWIGLNFPGRYKIRFNLAYEWEIDKFG